MEVKNYLASDLATELNVPRTTVNDWLRQYEAYLQTEMRGKRRAYTAKSLEVLKFIAAMREEGRSGSEIEGALAAQYGIPPEIAGEHEPMTAKGAATEKSTELSTAGGQNLPVQLSGEAMAGVFKMLEHQEAERRRIERKVRNFVLLTVLLLLVALGVPLTLLGSTMLQTQQQAHAAEARRYAALAQTLNSSETAINKFTADQRKRDKSTEELTRQAAANSAKAEQTAVEYNRKMESIGVLLDRSRQDYRENLQKLQSELAAQRTSHEATMRKLMQQKEKQHEAEIAKLRSDFAVRQLATLKSLEEQTRLRTVAEEARKKSGAATATTMAKSEQLIGELRRQLEAERSNREKAEQALSQVRRENMSLVSKKMPVPDMPQNGVKQ